MTAFVEAFRERRRFWCGGGVRRWWEHLLHNQDAFQLKARLWIRRGTAVTSVPYHLD